MTCLTEEQLLASIDGGIAPNERAALDAHLAGCATRTVIYRARGRERAHAGQGGRGSRHDGHEHLEPTRRGDAPPARRAVHGGSHERPRRAGVPPAVRGRYERGGALY